MSRVAVVVLNWNGEGLLPQFLPSVLRYAQSEDYSVVVADNASTDGSVAWLRSHAPQARVIELDRNWGFPGGYNRALQQVEAEFYMLLNSDVEVTPGWISELVRFMDDHPQAAACQPKLRSWRERDRFEYAGAAGGYLDACGYPFCRGRLFDTVESDRGQYDTPRPLLWATGAALFIRSVDYHRAGGMDERFFAHMEEIDLCWRLCSRGRAIYCVPGSVVYHLGGATLSKSNPQKCYLNFRNNLLMLYKNLPPEELAPVMRRRALLDWVALLAFLLRLHFKEACAVWRARRDFGQMRPAFAASRRENLAAAQPDARPPRFPGLLLFYYHLRGCKSFRRLARFWR